MDIVFIGTAPFAVPSLRALVAAGHSVPLVVTQPDRPAHRLRLTPSAVKVAARELELEVFQPERLRAPEAVERLRQVPSDLYVVAAYGQIISAQVLALPRRGVLNVHASLLPRWRGASPVVAAILHGDPQTGVTIMQMDELLDHGPILRARSTPIGERETAPELTQRLAGMGAELLVETIEELDTITPREQDHDAATHAGKLSREDGELTWDLDAVDIDRHVRALNPWPGVTLELAGHRVKVLRGHPSGGSGRPGTVLSTGKAEVEVAAGRGSYVLEEVQNPGGRPAAAAATLHHRA
ncbi:MAG: methionyl-tRNA formyltransferase [Candidatus Dormibacteraeota bacterium]|nr:methionyl-tRNA formyltransferase [Candidatus Dormibacteraeota bacterium]MBO0743404.1 methionyl-tRNA formyltransferase [Candidatus Dormibacteraeota bacterium]